jgi:hypothetical protein
LLTGAGGKNISIDFRQQAAQVYLLVVRNSRNEIVATQKIVKE